VDVLLGPNPINRLLHLAVATVAAFHGVGSGWQQLVVEERQGLVELGRAKLVHDRADLLEAANALTQLGQFRQGGVRATAPIKPAVHLLHEVAQRSQLRQAPHDLAQRAPFRGRQIVLDEEMAMLEESRDFVSQPRALARGS
jgi:hypothetical protein